MNDELKPSPPYRVELQDAAPEHVASADCWCLPEVEYVDSETGATVYVHRSLQ